jgi:hypothetical protein
MFKTNPTPLNRILNARLLVLALGVSPLALITAQAQAATVTNTGQSTTLSTSTASNGGPADTTLTGTVSVANGTAVIVDSNNSFTNQGQIESKATSNGVGLSVNPTNLPGQTLTGTVTNTGSVTVNSANYITAGQTAPATPGSNNTGVLIGGTGTFVGNYTSSNGTTSSGSITVGGDNSQGFSLTSSMIGNIDLYSINVSGQNSRGLSVTGNLQGNLTLNGTVSSTGPGGIGAYVGGNVQGHLYNIGSVTSGTTATYDRNGHLIPATGSKASMQISGNLSGGFLNDRIYKDASGNVVVVTSYSTDTTTGVTTYTGPAGSTTTLTATTGTLNAIAGGYALLITPNRPEEPLGNLVIGDYGSGDLSYAIVNHGNISSTGSNKGTAATAIRIEGATVNAVNYTTLAGSGIANLFDGSITATSIDAAATTISIGAGATVPTIRNDGVIHAYTQQSVDNSSNPSGPGGVASGIAIDAGATVNQFINTGILSVDARGATSSAYGIIDRSGTITSFTNSGKIIVTTGIGVNNNSVGSTGAVVAADLSYGSEDIHFVNSGTITGSVYLGSGNNQIELTGGTLTGLLDPGAGHSTAVFSGTSILQGGLITNHGQLDLTMQDSSQLKLTGNYQLNLSSLTLKNNAVMQVAIDGSGTPGINVTGAANLLDNSHLTPFISGVVSGTQTVTILQAGSLTVADPANVVALGLSPFMYNVGAVTLNGNALTITLTRKTAADLGLSPATGTLYENSIATLALDAPLAQAVSNQSTEAGFISALRQMEPPSFGTAIRQSAQVMQDAAFGSLSHRLATLRDIRRGEEGEIAQQGFWVQELGVFYKQKDNAQSPGFHGHTYGVALGVDTAALGLDTVGIGFSQGWANLYKEGTISQPITSTSTMFDIYGDWTRNKFFIHGIGSYGFNSYDSKRAVIIDSFSRLATAKWHARQLSANLMAGYEMQAGRHFFLTPSANLTYLKLSQRGYSETGGQGIDFVVDSNNISSMRGGANLAAAYLIQGESSRFKIDAHVGWDHEFNNLIPATTARFALAGNSFTMTGKALSSSIVHAGLGFTYLTSISSLSLSYDFQKQGDYRAHGITATFRVAF